jgi:predicted nucleic acid-binding protein
MFLLDTNVVSELGRFRRADPNVVRWADSFPVTQFYLSAICLTELELGVRLMERRDPAQGVRLRRWFDGDVLSRFESRILVVDQPIALCCAGLHVPDPRPAHDALIAATAIVHGLTLATRNTSDFERMGVELINPWIAN